MSFYVIRHYQDNVKPSGLVKIFGKASEAVAFAHENNSVIPGSYLEVTPDYAK